MVKVPTAPLVVSKAEPVRVGLVTETELAPFPVKVIFWLLGPNVIWAACAPDPQRAAKPIAIRSFVIMMGLSKGNMPPIFMTSQSNYRATIFSPTFSRACDCLICDIEPQV